MIGLKSLWPILRLLPPEFAHQLALLGLRMPLPAFWKLEHDPYEWQGLRFRNRVGIAAGFDKNASALRGIESLGVGFVEVGTVLVRPWPGNDLRPRVKRIKGAEGIWNRLGFPSLGLEMVARNLTAFPREQRNGLAVGCNIGPHPGNLRMTKSVADYLATARDELMQLAKALFEHADFFVVNLSSPNTQGLRDLLENEDLASRLFQPIRQLVRELDASARRGLATPVLVKLPPEDADRLDWTPESLQAVVGPLLAHDSCDGFVAVNTSSRLAIEFGEEGGGISGGPLRSTALDAVRQLRLLVGDEPLILGAGGITDPEHASEFVQAGSNLVEMYSGLVYRGPGLIAECVKTLRDRRAKSTPSHEGRDHLAQYR
jgi:dihydroorotate dehydrogenase